RSMVRMLHAPIGFQPKGVMLAEVDFSLVGGGNAPLEKKKAVIEAVAGIPGFTAAGALSRSPLNGGLRGIPVFSPGTTEFTLNNSVLSPYGFTISPGYLETARTRLFEGRDVSWRDTANTPYVAIVNRTFARKMWGDAPPIGQRFIFLDRLREVVGVVEDGKYHSMTESPQPAVFLPLSQNEQTRPTFAVRANRSQNEMAPAIERVLHALEPDALITIESWPDTISYVLFPARAATVALGVMGFLAS